MRVSVVIPALDEARFIEGAIASAWAAGADEVIVADGGSRDGTNALVLPPSRLVRSLPGRARQISAGWSQASGDVLLILHADSRLPAAAADAVRAAVAGGAVGGAFHKRFDSRHPLLRRVRWRTRLWWAAGLAFGDQAQFVRRSVLEQLGGLREDVRAEDMDLSIRMRRIGPCRLLPSEVITSARRLVSRGILRTWATWWRIGLTQLASEAVRRRT